MFYCNFLEGSFVVQIDFNVSSIKIFVRLKKHALNTFLGGTGGSHFHTPTTMTPNKRKETKLFQGNSLSTAEEH